MPSMSQLQSTQQHQDLALWRAVLDRTHEATPGCGSRTRLSTRHSNDCSSRQPIAACVRWLWRRQTTSWFRALKEEYQAAVAIRRSSTALMAIPYGETRTCNEVAASIGKRSPVRAVAHTCATNPGS